MTTLVLGATGATGSLVVQQLLAWQQKVRLIARHGSRLPEGFKQNSALEIIYGNVADISSEQMQGYLQDCSTVISCLGHNLSFRGIYGKPRRLVTDAVRTLYQATKQLQPKQPIRFILMNSSGVQNKGLGEKLGLANAAVIFLLRYLLPPHADNEQASAFLEKTIGTGGQYLEWVAVRPDTLIDESTVSRYLLEPSPVRDAIFNAGKVSRINVAHLMAALTTDDSLWAQWRYRFPVVYGQD